MLTYNYILQELYAKKDAKYKDFVAKLTPTIEKRSILGVRMALLRSLARDVMEKSDFDIFSDSSFTYREEKLLYALCIFKMNSKFEDAMRTLDAFLPYIDSWEVTDLLAGEFRFDMAHKEAAFDKAASYIQSMEEYTVRLGLVIMLKHFNEVIYMDRLLCLIEKISVDAYYVNMAAAWLLCELYFTKKDAIENYLASECANEDIKKKTLQKIRESMKK